MTGFDALMQSIDQAPDKLKRQTILKAQKLAEQVAGQARQGAPVSEGRIRNSIQSFVEVHGDVIEGGAKTSYPPAVYHEFGTGPVGDSNPHPMDGDLGITRRPDGWTYWSDDAVGRALPSTVQFGPHKGETRKETEKNVSGYVYTEGIPAQAFMYNAMKASEEQITASLGDCVMEVFLDK